MKILFAWIGRADLDAEERGGLGPILDALQSRTFNRVHLLCNWPHQDMARYRAWLALKAPGVEIVSQVAPLSQPNAFTEIYRFASAFIAEAVAAEGPAAELTFHLSPGTPVMAAVWLLLATSRFPAELVESSAGSLNTVERPFDLPAEILPDLLREPDRRLADVTAERPDVSSSFGAITTRSPAMNRAVALARKAAPRSVPLLIEGESGTGKELLARAVHSASPRSGKDMIVVNCGAIPSNLVESRLFGHVKGAFTGAERAQPGCFEEADGSTLFLDEIGELPLPAQVALLRVLQEGEVTRIGENRIRKVDVRVIAATNRELFAEIIERRFREDLFYRLAVLRIRLPALREREGDIPLLVDEMLARINEEMASDPLFEPKTLSVDARALLLIQSWGGNVRELQNTLRRALVWADRKTLQAEDIADALLPEIGQRAGDVLGLSLGNGFNLDKILRDVETHYICRALEKAGGNKSRAARLIGYSSYQRLDARCEKLGL